MKLAAFVFLYAISLYQVYWRGFSKGAYSAIRWMMAKEQEKHDDV